MDENDGGELLIPQQKNKRICVILKTKRDNTQEDKLQRPSVQRITLIASLMLVMKKTEKTSKNSRVREMTKRKYWNVDKSFAQKDADGQVTNVVNEVIEIFFYNIM